MKKYLIFGGFFVAIIMAMLGYYYLFAKPSYESTINDLANLNTELQLENDNFGSQLSKVTANEKQLKGLLDSEQKNHIGTKEELRMVIKSNLMLNELISSGEAGYIGEEEAGDFIIYKYDIDTDHHFGGIDVTALDQPEGVGYDIHSRPIDLSLSYAITYDKKLNRHRVSIKSGNKNVILKDNEFWVLEDQRGFWDRFGGRVFGGYCGRILVGAGLSYDFPNFPIVSVSAITSPPVDGEEDWQKGLDVGIGF